jgi:hypothetical protein
VAADVLSPRAQVPNHPYLGLWARLQHFDPAELAALVERREVVRIAVMRSTIHSVSARDCLTLRPLTQVVHERGFRSNWLRRLPPGIDLEAVSAAGASSSTPSR